jgi:flagellar hook-length control protein FliK
MNLAITNQIPSPASAAASATPAPALAAQGGRPASAPTQDAVPAFAQWLDQLSASADLMADQDGQDATTGTKDAAQPAASTDSDAQDARPSASVQDPALLAAMAMPLMAPAAAGIAPLPLSAGGEGAPPVARGTPAQPGIEQLALHGAAAAGSAPPALLGGALAATLPTSLAATAAPTPLPLAATGAPVPVPQPRAAAAGDMQDQASPGAATPSVQAAPRFAAAASGSGERTGADQAAPSDTAAAGVTPGGWGIATPSTGQPSAPATVALAGPPTAWRQSLQEALGDRLHMQVGNNIEQAVIRLEPPDLGRIDIAIRHSAGTLEVALSATHSDVVRQLHSVSDNLRNDLAGRQYAEVTVSVSQAPRAPQAGPSAFADQQGRQRQGGREQDDAAPGLALADASGPSSTFSLNGRE